MADEKAADTAPAETDANGVAMTGKLPHNHRLRAEALAKAGRKTDPDGIISGDLIEDAAARLKAESVEAKAAAKDTPAAPAAQ